MQDTDKHASSEEHTPEILQSPLPPTPTNKLPIRDMLIIGMIGLVVGVLAGSFLVWCAVKSEQLSLAALFFVVYYILLVIKAVSFRRQLRLPRRHVDKLLDDLQWMACIIGFIVVHFGISPYII